MKVLFFHVNRLGDAVVSLPAIQMLRQLEPTWEILVVAGKAETKLYQTKGAAGAHVGHAVSQGSLSAWPEERTQFNNSWRAPWRLFSLWRRVRKFRPDACVLSFDQGNVAHWLARASGARIRIGAAMPYIKIRGSLTHEVDRPPGSAPALWSWQMGRVLWQELNGHPEAWPELPPPPQLPPLVDSAEKKGRGIVMHAGASSAFTQWPLERFAETACLLAADFPVTWIDRPETSAVVLDAKIKRVATLGIDELVAALAANDFFVGNNSGPMHLANALGLAGLVISGPTALGWDPFWHRPTWTVLRRDDLPCQPCQPVDVVVRSCQNRDRPHACLRDWSAAEVAARCRQCIQFLDTHAGLAP